MVSKGIHLPGPLLTPVDPAEVQGFNLALQRQLAAMQGMLNEAHRENEGLKLVVAGLLGLIPGHTVDLPQNVLQRVNRASIAVEQRPDGMTVALKLEETDETDA